MNAIRRTYRYFGRSTLTMAAIVVLLGFVLIGIFAPWLAPYDPNAQNLGMRLQPPLTDGHLLGTDSLGRDVLSRLIYGSRVSLMVGFSAVLLAAVLGIVIGLVSGYLGGWVDSLLMRIVDAFLAFPFLLLAIAIVAVLGRGLDNIVIALVITGWVLYARLVRGSVLAIRQREFVDAAIALGRTRWSVLFKHALPNAIAPIIVQSSLQMAVAILFAAGLGFLGLGAKPPQPEWGLMLARGREYLAVAPHVATFPGLAIILVVLGFNLLGDGLRDIFDPRLRGSR